VNTNSVQFIRFACTCPFASLIGYCFKNTVYGKISISYFVPFTLLLSLTLSLYLWLCLSLNLTLTIILSLSLTMYLSLYLNLYLLLCLYLSLTLYLLLSLHLHLCRITFMQFGFSHIPSIPPYSGEKRAGNIMQNWICKM
jgi:hypothetical protein